MICKFPQIWICATFFILRSAEWWFHTDVSGQPIGPILKEPIVCPETSVHNHHSTLR